MIVVKLGGKVTERALDYVLDDAIGKRHLVLVHGGGNFVSELSNKLGVEPKFVVSPNGIKSRYTSKEELEVYTMAMRALGEKIALGLEKRGVSALSISGVHGGLVLAKRKRQIVVLDERGRRRVIEGGYTGKIAHVKAQVLTQLLEIFDAVVVSPIAFDAEEGVALNVDGDQMAYEVACALKAETLVFLSDVEGVMVDGCVLRTLNPTQFEQLSQKIGAGMNRKVASALEALKKGVSRVIIASGMKPSPIKKALMGEGTLITC